MNGLGIAGKVQFGYGKAGQKLGLPHALYRPTLTSRAALAPEHRLRTLPFISSATPDAGFARPSKHGAPLRYGLFDSRLTRPGDYIDGPTGTVFIASQRHDEVPMVVDCNAVVTVYRPLLHTQASEDVYGGRSAATDTLVLAAAPASVVIGERTQATRADLPGDVPIKGAMVLLPAALGVPMRVMDHLLDQLGRRYTVSSAELTDLGWRLTTTLSEA